ncbi:radical SAM protein, partial [bacterium]|nr:radical SAM protein [candidate division CSSED10-310 bacterium]
LPRRTGGLGASPPHPQDMKQPSMVLATPTPPDISAFGVRSISAYLKAHNCHVRCVYLPGGIEELSVHKEYVYHYPEQTIQDFLDLCSGVDLVGFSFLSSYRDRALQLTEAVHRAAGPPVVWGGVHATLRPGQSLASADYVCVGEGEEPLHQLLNNLAYGKSAEGIPGIWMRLGEVVQPAAQPPLLENLDALPYMDFSLDDQHILEPRSGRIVPMTRALLAKALPLMPFFRNTSITVYRTMTTRGCPHRCTYCVNHALAGLYDIDRYLRWRSPEHVMEELTRINTEYDFIKGVHFFDDVFTAMPKQQLERFCELYRTRIGLPFYCQVSPRTVNRRMLDLLLESGMVFIEMGIQTGCTATRTLYRRPETNRQVLTAGELFADYRGRLLTTRYHVILDNPWETPMETRETLLLLTSLPTPFVLCLSSLTLYPGTELNILAKEQGMLRDEIREVYRKPFYKPLPTYINFLITISDIRIIPRGLLRLMAAPCIVRRWGARPATIIRLLLRLVEIGRLIGKGVDAVFRGDFMRIRRYMTRIH